MVLFNRNARRQIALKHSENRFLRDEVGEIVKRLGKRFHTDTGVTPENQPLEPEFRLGILFSISVKKLFTKNQNIMLRWAIGFFIIAIIAAIFGFGGIAAGAASIAKVLFIIFIILFLLTLIFGARVFGK
ncbi:DUF1328 family protein [Algoriphagus jejuensis]|uniref:DUF1328 family protein n=1 Tax=Algoriphagus jejuensis TaxID=419934 RepID=UPI003CD0BF78